MTHPGIEAIRAFLADSALSSGTIEERRAAMDAATAGLTAPAGTTVTATRLAGRPAETITVDGVGSADVGTVLYLHGGAYCLGSLESHRDLAGRLALAAQATVVTLDYRLAPEHPFPAAVDDATAAYRELVSGGRSPDSIAFAGDSAGGGLTMAALVALRDAGDPLPAAAVCLSPWVDLTQSAGSYAQLQHLDPMIDKDELDMMAAAYLGTTSPEHPLASPLFAELHGLPPMLVHVGEHEALLDDATGLAERATDARVDVTLRVWPEMIHVFQAFPADVVPETAESLDEIATFLRGHLARSVDR